MPGRGDRPPYEGPADSSADAQRLAELVVEVRELRQGTGILSSRVEAMAGSLDRVNQIDENAIEAVRASTAALREAKDALAVAQEALPRVDAERSVKDLRREAALDARGTRRRLVAYAVALLLFIGYVAYSQHQHDNEQAGQHANGVANCLNTNASRDNARVLYGALTDTYKVFYAQDIGDPRISGALAKIYGDYVAKIPPDLHC